MNTYSSVNFSPSLTDISLISFPLFTSQLSHACISLHIINQNPQSQNHIINFNFPNSKPFDISSSRHHPSSILSHSRSLPIRSPMEPQTQQPTEDGGSNKAAGSSASMLCRQSSTRWTPTTDQIRILKELYYNKGVRSPSAEQIQRICLQLKRYGKIEGKNVFYWFQNHKARERQKKRFTSDVHVPMQRSGLVVGNGNVTNWKPEDQYMNMNNKYSNICQGVSSASASATSAGVIAFNGQMGNYGGYGSMNMEKSFRDCSISAGEGTGTTGVGVGGSISHNFGSWVGGCVDPFYSSYVTGTGTAFFDMNEQTFTEQQEEDHQEIETLPLFPMHGEDIFGNIKTSSDGGNGYGYYSGGWGGHNGGSRTSLELSLNSYGYNTPNYH